MKDSDSFDVSSILAGQTKGNPHTKFYCMRIFFTHFYVNKTIYFDFYPWEVCKRILFTIKVFDDNIKNLYTLKRI